MAQEVSKTDWKNKNESVQRIHEITQKTVVQLAYKEKECIIKKGRRKSRTASPHKLAKTMHKQSAEYVFKIRSQKERRQTDDKLRSRSRRKKEVRKRRALDKVAQQLAR